VQRIHPEQLLRCRPWSRYIVWSDAPDDKAILEAHAQETSKAHMNDDANHDELPELSDEGTYSKEMMPSLYATDANHFQTSNSSMPSANQPRHRATHPSKRFSPRTMPFSPSKVLSRSTMVLCFVCYCVWEKPRAREEVRTGEWVWSDV